VRWKPAYPSHHISAAALDSLRLEGALTKNMTNPHGEQRKGEDGSSWARPGVSLSSIPSHPTRVPVHKAVLDYDWFVASARTWRVDA
jgi:hypothetical protein